MNEHSSYFHWDLLRQPLQTPQFGGGAPFFDVNSLLELRKEKSRDAARSRRGKENYEFYELAKLLPLPAAITSQLDKASIIRLTISYLKLREFSSHGDPDWTLEAVSGLNKFNLGHQSRLDTLDPFESRQGTHILQSLDGFVFILGNDGRFLYISETVSIYLGLSQVEMAGSSIFEYVHSQDHSELAEHLGMCLMPIGPSGSPQGSCSDDGSPAASPATPRPATPSERGYVMVPSPEKTAGKSFCLRMKSTLTKRGVHVKTLGYRVIHIIGSVRSHSVLGLSRLGVQTNNSSSSNASSEPVPPLGFVGMALALPPPTMTELRLEVNTFVTRLSPDFRVVYCEPVISDLMDLDVQDVTDRLLYDLCHPADLKTLRRSHLDILNKGQALSDYYRLLNRHGGYVWVQTCATVLFNSKNSEHQNILAINFVVSGNESKSSVLDLWQVVGDVTSSMSSVSRNVGREDKLKETKETKSSVTASSKSGTHSDLYAGIKSALSSPSPLTEDRFKTGHETTDIGCPQTLSDITDDDGESSSPDKSLENLDNKNNRRKTETPQRRKRRISEAGRASHGEKPLNLTGIDLRTSVIAEKRHFVTRAKKDVYDALDNHKPVTATSWSLTAGSIASASPEDLSIKRVRTQSPSHSIIQHSSSAFRSVVSSSADITSAALVLNPPESTSSNSLSATKSTVRELEAAMNRHLPASTFLESSSQREKDVAGYYLSSSSQVVRGFPNSTNLKLSPVTHAYSPSQITSSKSPGSDALTAPGLLRSFYVTRESVIKSSPRHQVSFLSPEPPVNLLTPPEPDPATYREPNNPYLYSKSDALAHSHVYEENLALSTTDSLYKDKCSFIHYKDHTPPSYVDHISSSVYKDYFPAPYKEMSSYKDIIQSFTIPSLMSPVGRIHQAYPSFQHHVPVPSTTAHACSITPPSSNSPDISIKHAATAQHFDSIINASTSTAGNTCNISLKHGGLNSSVHTSPSSRSSLSSQHYHLPLHQSNLYQGVHNSDPTKENHYGTYAPTGSVYMDLNQQTMTHPQHETSVRHLLPWY